MSQLSTRGSSEAEATSFRESLQPLFDILRRIPYTASVVVVMFVLGFVSQSFWRPISESGWWPNVAYGLPAFEEGRWWTPISGAFFARIPGQYIPVLGGYAVMTGFAEWRLGTRMTVIATVVGQLAGVLGTAGLLALFRGTDWAWAVETARALDVGFSSGAICALVVAAMTLRAPWRGRIIVAVFGYSIVSFVWVGLVWDIEHVISSFVGLAIGWRRSRTLFAGDGKLTRHETRVIATVMLLLIALAQILAMAFPEDGPLGPEAAVVGRPLIILFIVAELLVAAGLHRGSRLAWSAATALSITGVLTATALRPPARGVAAALVFLPLLVLLLRTRRAYTAKIIPPSSTRMTRDVALIGVGFLLYVILGFVVIEDFRPPPDLIMQARELVARLFFATSGAFVPTSRTGTVFLVSLSLIPIVVFFSVLLVLFIRTRKPAAAVNRERALELLHTYGGGNLSWMATWPDNAHFITADGKAAIAYQVKGGTAIALGDPVGAPESVGTSIAEFARDCETHGWVPCMFSSTRAVLPQ
ncbi:MAG TPA: phosphatidylglycerol lysyltransferase domain-containing protein, partial [Lapillicoccus sp.]